MAYTDHNEVVILGLWYSVHHGALLLVAFTQHVNFGQLGVFAEPILCDRSRLWKFDELKAVSGRGGEGAVRSGLGFTREKREEGGGWLEKGRDDH